MMGLILICAVRTRAHRFIVAEMERRDLGLIACARNAHSKHILFDLKMRICLSKKR